MLDRFIDDKDAVGAGYPRRWWQLGDLNLRLVLLQETEDSLLRLEGFGVATVALRLLGWDAKHGVVI